MVSSSRVPSVMIDILFYFFWICSSIKSALNFPRWYRYNGANIPGKPKEPLNYAGGIPLYIKTITECLENNYDGFVVS